MVEVKLSKHLARLLTRSTGLLVFSMIMGLYASLTTPQALYVLGIFSLLTTYGVVDGFIANLVIRTPPEFTECFIATHGARYLLREVVKGATLAALVHSLIGGLIYSSALIIMGGIKLQHLLLILCSPLYGPISAMFSSTLSFIALANWLLPLLLLLLAIPLALRVLPKIQIYLAAIEVQYTLILPIMFAELLVAVIVLMLPENRLRRLIKRVKVFELG